MSATRVFGSAGNIVRDACPTLGIAMALLTTEPEAISSDQMRQVLEVTRLLATTPDLDTLLTHIATSATVLLGAERASIFLHDPKTRELWTKVALGAKEIRVPCTAGIVGAVFGANQLLHTSDPYNDPRFNREVDKRLGFRTRNLLTTPTRDTARKPIGVLQVVNRVGGDFSDSDKLMIEMLADQAGVAIQRHYLMEEVVRGAELKLEMNLAQRVQMAMIPRTPPQIPGLRCAGWTLPASTTGGDTYDLWQMPDGSLGIFLGDASGHGIAPAIIVCQTRTLIRSLSEINSDPNWLLTRTNARLALDLDEGRFVTAFLGCLSPGGLLQWSSTGHGPMFYRAGASGPCELLDPLGPPLGIMPDIALDPAGQLQLDPGGMLIVLSDGIFEARSPTSELLEVERVRAFFDSHAGADPEQLIPALRKMLVKWQGKETPVDDQTAVIIQRESA
jgi:phosphoserine phosphatase RsbU/P